MNCNSNVRLGVRDSVSSPSALASPGATVLGWHLAQIDWGKMRVVGKVTSFFMSLTLVFSAFNAFFIPGLRFLGVILLVVVFSSSVLGFLLIDHVSVAYWTIDREALSFILFDPSKFYVADPFTLLFESSIAFIFGAGFLPPVYIIAKRFEVQA